MRHTLVKNVKIAVMSIMALFAAMIAKAQDAGDPIEDKADALAESRYLRSIYKTDEAISVLEPFASQENFDSDLFAELAECHIQNGDLEKAAGILEVITSLAPDNLKYQVEYFSVLYKLKEYPLAVETSRKILAIDSIPAIMSFAGDCWNLMDEPDSALAYYSMSLKHKPLNENVVSKAAKIYLGRKDYDMAVELSDSLLRLSPDNQTVAPIKGLALYLKGDYGPAIKVFERQEELGNDSYGVHYNLGQCYWRTKKAAKAVEELEAAWQIDSSDVNLAYSIACALSDDYRPFEPDVKKWLDKALSMMEPDHGMMSRIHQQYGYGYYKEQTSWDEAIEHYKEAYRYNPDFISALSTIAYCYEQKKDYKSALGWYERYLSRAKPGSKGYNFAKESIDYLKGELFMEEK